MTDPSVHVRAACVLVSPKKIAVYYYCIPYNITDKQYRSLCISRPFMILFVVGV